MTDFENFKKFFQFLKMEHCPQKHWSNTMDWTMAKTMHSLVLQAIKVVVQKTLFILVNCDEVTTIDNQSWLSIHLYVIDGWKWVSILLNLQKVLDGATSTNLTKLIVWSLVEFGSMIETNVANKLVCFGADGVTNLQGFKYGVTTKLI